MTTDGSQQQQGDISELRARADQASAFEQANSDLQRELAFTKAGIDTDSDLGRMVMRGYDGELTPEALAPLADQFKAMSGLGQQPQTPPPSDPTQGQPPVDPTQVPGVPAPPGVADVLDTMGQGVPPGQTPPRDLRAEGWEKFRERLASGARPEDAAAELVDRFIDGAVRELKGEAGYQGFVFNKQAFLEGA